MEEKRSFLLGALGKSFKDILKGAVDSEQVDQVQPSLDKEKKKKKVATKIDKTAAKEEKSSKEKTEKESKDAEVLEKKFVPRDGSTSLITYSNASNFAVFSHVRNFVLQNQLCEMFNTRFAKSSDDEPEEDETEEEAKKRKQHGLSKVVSMGVRGVFEIIRETWHSHPELCVKALQSFLDLLQGQAPSGLKYEPKEITDALYELLSQMVSEESGGRDGDPVSSQLSSVACACLLSLVVGLGDTSKMLSAISMMLIGSSQLSTTIQVPQIFLSLQKSVQAVLLKGVREVNWSEHGVQASSMVDSWKIEDLILPSDGRSAIASDGQWLYVHCAAGLLKLGSGYGGTRKGFVYQVDKDFYPNDTGWLGYGNGKLYFFKHGLDSDTILVIDPKTFKVDNELQIPDDSLGSQSLFITGEKLGQIRATKEGGFLIREFTTLASPLVAVEEKPLNLAQRNLLCMGKAKYDQQEHLHTLYATSANTIERVVASRTFAVVQTTQGKLYYTGNGEVFGITDGKETKPGEWAEIPSIPDNDSKITFCTCDTNGTYFIVVCENETVYFRGTNKKGESGEAPANNPKPIPYKKIEKVKDVGIISASCGNHTTALLSKEGQLYMFGDLPISGITDEASGVVTALLGIPVSQVVLGHSHTCVLTQLGTVYTFGGNNYGQCGRDYQPQEEEKKQNMPVEESSSSEEEEEEVIVKAHAEIMCRGGNHSWSRGECRVCSVCGYCTGYGPNCVNTDRYLDPGILCGCGAGDAGCEDCGCCKVCGGELDPHEMINHDNSIDDDIEYIYEDGREDVKARMEANEIELKKKVKRKKKKPKKEEDKKKDKEALAQDPNYLPVPSQVHFTGDMTAMQIECGTFHTVVLLHSGEVFTFGNNNHGQLGQGHTKPCGDPSKVDLPGPASQIACGDNHTVILLASGEIYTFGKHKEGQLGRSKENGDDMWYAKPGAMASVGDASGLRKASWISARGNQTFVSVHESLLSETSVSRCSIFANSDVIGILPQEKDMYLVVLDHDTTAKRFDGSDQAELHGKAFCIDPVYNVLWTHSVADQLVCCYNPIAAGIQGTNPAGTILSPSLVLPSGPSCGQISKQLAALNLLSCINTLASCSEMSLDMILLPSGAKPNPDDFSTVMRFEKFSGSWGYGSASNPTFECIRFNASQEILLGGIGLFAGRGEYKADIVVYDLGKSGGDTNEPTGKLTVLTQHKEDTYKTASKEIKKVFFPKPVALKPSCWYLVKVCIHGPSSDAGGDGKRTVTGEDGIKFSFMNSKHSNNGTDARSGQIPLIIYRLASGEDDKETEASDDKKESTSVHLIKKDFAGTVSEVGIQAVLKLLEWSWHLFSDTNLVGGSGIDIGDATFIATTCVNLLKIYITYAYPIQGIYRPTFDNPVMAQSIYDVHCIMKYILSSRHSSVHPMGGDSDKGSGQLVAPVKKIINACHVMFRECFHVFYPSGVLKWYAACRFLERLDPHDIYSGIPGEKLLSAVLDALSAPSTSYIGLNYDTTVSLSAVLRNTEPEKRYPMLAEFMHMKALEEEGDRELLSFEIIASKLLSVVAVPLNASLRVSHSDKLPVSSIVESSGRFLVSRMTELALAASHSEAAKLSSLSVEENSKSFVLHQLPSRYSNHCNDLPQVDVTDLLFSVDKPIVLHSLNLFGEPEKEYKFTAFVAKESDGVSLTGCEGQATASKDGTISAQFTQAVEIMAETRYRVHVLLNTVNEPSYRMGEGGKERITTEEGAVFTFYDSEQQYCDYRTSVVASVIYSFGHDASNPVELSIALTALFLEIFVNFLEQFLSSQSPAELMEQAGNSFFLSTLLPIALAHLGPIVCYHPKYVIKVLTLMKRVLPLVCAINQKMGRADGVSTPHMNGMHYALVETEHPYKAPGVNLFNVKFTDEVQWMSLEFDSRSGFAQQWDKMEEFVIPNVSPNIITSTSNNKTNKEPVKITIDKSEVHYKWGDNEVEIPNGLVLLPGNEVNVRVVMDTEYEKHDDANHYGIRCQVVGYEWSASHKQVLKVLERELVNLSATLSSFLLQENTKLPWIEELPVDASYGSIFAPTDLIPPRDPEKADMRIVESAAKDVLVSHPQLLGRGIAADMPSVSQVLLKDLPVKQLSSEQIFLKDFISCSSDTPGARMAKWLQPDRSVDMQASELIVPSEGATCWENVTCTAQTRDHDGTRVYVPHMKVEIKLIWLRADPDAVPMDATCIECMMGVYRPCYDKPYASTRINNYQFNSIPIMMAYSDYSFEELRLFSPRGPKNPDYMRIDNQENGNYTAHWVPTVPGVYSVQLYVDGRHTGQSKELIVKEKPAPEEDEEETMADEEKDKPDEGEEEKDKEEPKVVEKEEPKVVEKAQQPEMLLVASAPKAKRFYGRDSNGLRVRSEPSLLSSMVGLLKPGDLVHYDEEVTNDAGRWVKLAEESLAQYCDKPTAVGYALCYSDAAKKTFLEDEEIPVPVTGFPQQSVATASAPQPIKHRRPRNKKRMGGPGEYEVVQCGSAGHNIRSQPNMNGAPVGRLTLKDTFTAAEEVENKDGIWLRLSEGDAKKHCTGEKKSNVWTLACASSGRLFIRMIGDDYEFGVPIIAVTASKASVSQQLFSAPKATTVFSTSGALSKPSSAPVKLSFGQQEKPAPTPVSSSTSSTASEKEEKKDSKEAKDMKGKKLQKQASLARRRAGTKKAATMTKQDSEVEEVSTVKSSSTESVKIIQALSPAVAECQRAVYAAFLWHQGLVHDAMASSFHLKLHPSLSKEMINQGSSKGSEESAVSEKKDSSEKKGDEGEEKKEDVVAEEKKEPTVKSLVKDDSKKSSKDGTSLPPTLSHLVTFWEEISAKVLEISNQPLTPPKIPSIVRELQKEFEEHKKSEDKRKKEAKKPLEKAQQQGPALCELCDGNYSDPVTYHMKEAHPGCGKHAGGFGYNSRGSFCSGWAGNCGDGGKGGSTWYLMCKDCHEKYLAEKISVKKISKPVLIAAMKTVQQPGKPRVLQSIPSIQGLIQNAQFLLEVNGMSDTSLFSGKQSELMQHTIASTSSAISPTELKKAESIDADVAMKLSEPAMSRPKFLRSLSLWPETTEQTPTENESSEIDKTSSLKRQPFMSPDDSEGVFDRPSLVERPSMALARLVYKRSRHEDKEDPYSPIIAFIVNRYDLDGLRVTMRQAMCTAAIKSHALEMLQWLLHMVKDTGAVHDTLWQFVTTICPHPMDEKLAKMKDKEKDKDKQKTTEGTEAESLGRHPLLGLDGAGTALVKLRRQFHCFLLAVSELMPKLPMGSAVQQMAMKCWCLQFQPEDQSFLIQSNVFANISTVLSNVEEVPENADKKIKSSQPPSEKATGVWMMQNVLPEGRLKPSSNDAMVNSLTDGSTETFWESRDEPRSKTKALMVTFNDDKKLYAAAIHNDNGKDSGQRITEMSLLIGPDEANLKKVDECNLSTSHSGWTVLLVPADANCQVLRVELKGSSNNVRVRQLQVLAKSGAGQEPCIPAVVAQQRSCEVEALRIFRLLTSQVFGSLLSTKADKKEDEPDSGEKEEKDQQSSETDLHEQLGSLFGKDQLNRMQKRVCEHVIKSIHSEAERMKEDWKSKLGKQVKPDEQDKPQESSDEAQGQSSPDTYCFELVSMVMGLCESEVGRLFLAEQAELIRDLLVLLHVSATRIQLQVVALLEKVIPDITPRKLADYLDITMLPPEGYSAIAAAISSGTAVLNHVGLLDIFLACISKALSVQAKAKGRSAGLLQDIGGGPKGPGITLTSLLASEKTVSVEAEVKEKRWWLKGSISVEVATEIIKFLRNMTKGEYGTGWSEVAKAAIGQTVLHLTKLTEDSRVPIPGMYSQTLWLCLGALCVIDEHHAEVLSSGQWMGQDGKPRTKPLCDNHDDGVTQALILCDVCGNLCGDCDRILHLPKRMKSHQRQVFKEEEEAVKVDLHEGCGRIKLYWAMVLADCRTLKGLIEFRETTSGTGGGQCRFCGSTNDIGLLAIGSVCAEKECQNRAKVICTKTLPCGHPCNGVQGEEECLPCLCGCKTEQGEDDENEVKNKVHQLKQDADDMCMICYTENLSCAPCIQLDCGHVFHYHCCDLALTKKWSGPRISFRFMFCSLCQNVPIAHPKLKSVLDPVIALYDDVKRKCVLRLEYENKVKCEALTSPTSKFYQMPFEYAMSIYCYYVCFKCKKSYYGGEARCVEQAGLGDEFDPSELVCGGCSDVAQAQVCAKHGTDFLEYKCRYCCSVAVYFCFGTTHFCNSCHNDFQRLTSMKKSEFPQCPVAPRAKPMEGNECPLHVKHPPTGEEFALGCGVCRNAQTF